MIRIQKKNTAWIAMVCTVAAILTMCGARPAMAAPPLGINIGWNLDWSANQICTDVIKQSRGWNVIGQGSTDTAPRDANGWPTTDAYTICIIKAGTGGSWAISGTYKITMNGQATITPLNCTATVANQIYNSGTNTTTADFTLAAGQVQLWIQFTNTIRTFGGATNTGFTNLKVIRPGYPADGSQPFTSSAVTAVSKFQVFRCMDAENTNTNTPAYPATTSWAQRVPPTYAFQGNSLYNNDTRGTGMCYELLIQLANICNNDIWINVPMSATDDYVTQLATLLKNTLHAGGHVYVELGNEDWNGQFPQTAYVQAWGTATGAGWFGQVGNRVAQISNLFKAVYGAPAINTTVRVVLAGQHTNTGTLTQAGDYIVAHYGPVSTFVYGTATGGYYSANATTNSVAAVLSSLTAASSSEVSLRQTDISVATGYGVQPIIYEGGPDLSTDSAVPQATLDASARDAGMTAIMVNDLNNNWFGIGGGLYMHFTESDDYGGGDWGLSEFGGDLGTAKWAAINQVLGTTGLPSAPSGLTATAGNAQVSLSWGAASGATSYNVYRGTTSGGESGTAIATGIATTSYINTGLTNGTTYFFTVKAVNSSGTSGASNEASATPTSGGTSGPVKINTGGPAVSPFIADADFSGGLTATNWTGTIDTSAVTSPAPQAVYQSEHYGNTTYTIGGLTANTTYQVRLHFCENYSSGSGQRVFNVSINGTSKLSNFDIYATTGTQHKANIQQFNVAANGSGQEVIVFTTVTGNALVNGIEVNTISGPPPAPTGLTATAGNAQVALSWTASSGATSYNVSRSTVSGSGYTSVATGVATTTYTNTGLTNGTTYYFVVSATNAGGTSANSAQASATPTAGGSSGLVKINCAGPAVSPFVADVDFSGGLTATNWTGTIDTSAVSSPAPQAVYQSERYGAMTYTMGGLTTGTTYQVRLHFCENFFTASAQRVFNATINSTAVLTNFDIFAATGAIHKANVQQFNAVANGSGQVIVAFTNVTNNALVNGIEVNTLSAPAAPTGLAATAGNAQVALNWTASGGATSYNVYRGTAAGGESGTAIATGIATTSFTNTGLTNGTHYYYTVKAVNAAGTSGASNEASATPTAGVNLVTNPGYETGSLGALWLGGGSYNVTQTAPHTGSWCGYEAGSWSEINQTLTGLQSNHTYTVTMYAKLSAAPGGSHIVLFAENFGGTSVTSAVSATAWTQYTVSFTTGASSTSAKIGLRDLDGSSLTGYADDWVVN